MDGLESGVMGLDGLGVALAVAGSEAHADTLPGWVGVEELVFASESF